MIKDNSHRVLYNPDLSKYLISYVPRKCHVCHKNVSTLQQLLKFRKIIQYYYCSSECYNHI